MGRRTKFPRSVLVVIHTAALDVLLIRRSIDAPDGQPFWQSVTGSKDSPQEDWRDTAVREVWEEETGICAHASGCTLRDWGLENVYDIYPQWLHRYAPGVRRNAEHLFSCKCPQFSPVVLNPRVSTPHGPGGPGAERRTAVSRPPTPRPFCCCHNLPRHEPIPYRPDILRIATYHSIHKGVQGIGPSAARRSTTWGMRSSNSMPTSCACRKCASCTGARHSISAGPTCRRPDFWRPRATGGVPHQCFHQTR